MSRRRFAQDDTFPLIAFDIVSRNRATGQISLMCKINREEMANRESVTASELVQKLSQDVERALIF